jgi:hypothetical protein
METTTRHSLAYKTKHFREKLPPRMESNSTKLISETDRTAVDVDLLEDQAPVLRQEDEEESLFLADIPSADTVRRSKRQRRAPGRDGDIDGDSDTYDDDETASAIEIDSDTEAPPHKRHRVRTGLSDDIPKGEGEGDDKKKLAMDVSYEGFAIYGQVLCLVIKKRDSGRRSSPSHGGGAAASAGVSGSRPEGQAMMENWISSTQMPVGEEVS